MRPLIARLLLVLATVLALGAWERPARAEAQRDAAGLAPRDVGVVVQPAAARIPAAPAEFVRTGDGWLTLELPGSVRERAESLMDEASSFRDRASAELGQPVLERVRVRVARDPEQMAALAPEGAPPPAYASAVAYPALHLVLLSMKAPGTWEGTDLPELLRHELMHVALTDAVAGHHVPRWFDEGLAIHESGELRMARLETLWQASLSRSWLSFGDLDRGFPAGGSAVSVAYAESADVVRFLVRDEDRARFGSLVQRLRAGADFDRALSDAYDTDVRKLEYEWREDVGHRFGVLPMLTGGGVLWTLMAGLAIAAWVKRRRRSRAKLAEWAREEADMDAAAAAARQHVATAEGEDDVAPAMRPSLPVVEHEGRWYTLH